MDPLPITKERDSIPDWARGDSRNDPNAATERQMDYIRSLVQEKDLSSLTSEQTEFLAGDFELTKPQASRVIETLVKLPRARTVTYSPADVALVEVPAGRYAVPNDDGELRFYKKWVSQDGKLHRMYVQHGPDESKLPHPAQVGVAKKILAAGVRECAIRYGMEIGECSNCGRRLTNRISRELGIGPICGGRMFGDDFKVDVKAKRKEIKARGQDPNEELF